MTRQDIIVGVIVAAAVILFCVRIIRSFRSTGDSCPSCNGKSGRDHTTHHLSGSCDNCPLNDHCPHK